MYFVAFLNPSVFFYFSFCYEIRAKDRRYFTTFPHSAHYLVCRWRRVVGYAPIALTCGKSHLNRKLESPENRTALGTLGEERNPSSIVRPAPSHLTDVTDVPGPLKKKGFRRKLQALIR
jgi:hypothetical protein